MTRFFSALQQTRLPAIPFRLLPAVEWARWRWLIVPTLAFIITRSIVLGGAYIAEIAIPSQTGPEYWHAMPDNVLMDNMARWDSGFYINIARDGYNFVPGQMSNVAFFPVYPLLMSVMSALTGGNLVVSGVLVSHICLYFALIFLYLLTELEFGEGSTATRSVYYLAAFPTALFFSAVYTESTFLVFSIGTFYFARRRMWAAAGIMGMLTSASRIVGVIVVAMVFLEWMRSHGWTLSTIHKREAWVGLWKGFRHDTFSLVFIALIPMGLLSYMFFLQRQFNDPIAFWTAQSAWGRGSSGLFGSIFRDINGLLRQNFATGEIWWNSLLNLIVLFAVIILSIPVWRRLGVGYAVYTLLGVLIPAASGTGSMIRYALVLFPIFMLLAHWGRHRIVDQLIMTLFCVFLGIFTAIFVNWVFLA